MANWIVPLSDIDTNQEEIQAVEAIINNRWLSMGGKTSEFEGAFSHYLGVKHAIAVTNGTAALHLAFSALGIKSENEVILPSLTFVATGNSVIYTGAEPVFSDITSLNDLTLSPISVQRCISPQTKAIAAMHYGGYPCDMDAIMEIARNQNLSVVEDSAHSPGALYKGVPTGNLGNVGCFSFYSNKNLTTGEGGMVTTNDDDLAEKIRLMRSHGMTSLSWDRFQGHASAYDVKALGYNYRIDDIRSAIGLVQLSKLEHNNNRRRAITRIYRECFADHPAFDIPFIERDVEQSSCHLFVVMMKKENDQARFRDHFQQAGIQTSLHYPPIHLFSYYRARFGTRPGHLPITEEAAGRLVTLPLFSSMTDQQVDIVVQAGKTFAA